MLEHVKQSYQKNADLSAGAKISRYGWADEAETEPGADTVAPTQSGQAQDATEEEDAGKIVEKYKQANATFNVNYDEQAHRIEASNSSSRVIRANLLKVKYKIPTLILSFVVTKDQDTAGQPTWKAESIGNGKLFPAMTRCIASRPRPGELKYLLDMIAAYKDGRIVPCANCRRVMDNSTLTCAARRSTLFKDAEGDDGTKWEAFHESCL